MNNIWTKLQDKYIILCPFYWRDLRYKIKCFFNPRNKWVSKAVSNQWRDKDILFKEILFAGIIHYVEEEKALSNMTWKAKEKEKIVEIYNWAKAGRFIMEREIADAYPKGFEWPISKVSAEDYFKLYGKVNELEKLRDNTDTKHLVWLVKNRMILWT